MSHQLQDTETLFTEPFPTKCVMKQSFQVIITRYVIFSVLKHYRILQKLLNINIIKSRKTWGHVQNIKELLSQVDEIKTL